MNHHPRTLTGTHIRLEPVTPAHREEMRAARDCDQANWDVQFVCARGSIFLTGYWEKMLHAPGRIAFAARDVAGGSAGEGRLAGTPSFLFVSPEQATLEIGSTFLANCQEDRRAPSEPFSRSPSRSAAPCSAMPISHPPPQCQQSW